MSHDPHTPNTSIRLIAKWILAMNPAELQVLREALAEGGDPTGVGAIVPPNLPLKEGGAEVPFENWPDDYFETME